MQHTKAELRGRLANPDLLLKDDPRADPRMIQAMAQRGLLESTAIPVTASSSLDELLAFCAAAEQGYAALNDSITASWPAVTAVTRETRMVEGADGNGIDLYIHRPERPAGLLPGILHLHGGGMVMMSATDSVYEHWRNELALSGLVVIGVEFRNGAGKLGAHPFPAGLNDCASALQWMAAHKSQLGISGIIISGESGGGNLSLATCLKAKRDGFLHMIDGIYAQCPLISNRYLDKDRSLPSLFENDELGLSCTLMAALLRAYDPSGAHANDALAWPLCADREDLLGLPPHFLSVCELDPLRDEGIIYTRKLLDAGVLASSRTINGITHAADMSFRTEMPDVYLASVRDINGFANSVVPD